MLRIEVLNAMDELRLTGMRAVFDEILTTSLKQRNTPERIILDLLQAEIAERTSRNIRYRLGLAKFPVEKDLDSFDFNASRYTNHKFAHFTMAHFYMRAAIYFLSAVPVQEKLIWQ